MAESFIQLAPDSTGKKAHTFQRTIGANTVEDEIVLEGEPYLSTYVASFNGVSVATLNDHLFQVMAGSSLNVYLRRIYLAQQAYSTTAATVLLLVRLTTAGTGGTARTPNPLDTGDTAAGATCMTLPTSKGTEGASLHQVIMVFGATGTTTLTNPVGNEFDMDFGVRGTKSLRIPAGTGNGVACKLLIAGGAGNTVTGYVEFIEANF